MKNNRESSNGRRYGKIKQYPAFIPVAIFVLTIYFSINMIYSIADLTKTAETAPENIFYRDGYGKRREGRKTGQAKVKMPQGGGVQ